MVSATRVLCWVRVSPERGKSIADFTLLCPRLDVAVSIRPQKCSVPVSTFSFVIFFCINTNINIDTNANANANQYLITSHLYHPTRAHRLHLTALPLS
jgi:hypothetical protein